MWKLFESQQMLGNDSFFTSFQNIVICRIAPSPNVNTAPWVWGAGIWVCQRFLRLILLFSKPLSSQRKYNKPQNSVSLNEFNTDSAGYLNQSLKFLSNSSEAGRPNSSDITFQDLPRTSGDPCPWLSPSPVLPLITFPESSDLNVLSHWRPEVDWAVVGSVSSLAGYFSPISPLLSPCSRR